jgi:hypothetical protein
MQLALLSFFNESQLVDVILLLLFVHSIYLVVLHNPDEYIVNATYENIKKFLLILSIAYIAAGIFIDLKIFLLAILFYIFSYYIKLKNINLGESILVFYRPFAMILMIVTGGNHSVNYLNILIFFCFLIVFLLFITEWRKRVFFIMRNFNSLILDGGDEIVISSVLPNFFIKYKVIKFSHSFFSKYYASNAFKIIQNTKDYGMKSSISMNKKLEKKYALLALLISFMFVVSSIVYDYFHLFSTYSYAIDKYLTPIDELYLLVAFFIFLYSRNLFAHVGNLYVIIAKSSHMYRYFSILTIANIFLTYLIGENYLWWFVLSSILINILFKFYQQHQLKNIYT